MYDQSTIGDSKAKPRSRGFNAGRPVPGAPRPVDVHVGSRLRLRRTLLGMTQESLGNSVGLTFQQIQKYERGSNRIGASRLFEFSRILDVTVSFFFDDMAEAVARATEESVPGLNNEVALALEPDPMARRETLELVRAYYRITSPKVRRSVFELTKTLGSRSCGAETAVEVSPETVSEVLPGTMSEAHPETMTGVHTEVRADVLAEVDA